MKHLLFIASLALAFAQNSFAQFCNPTMAPTAPNNRYIMNIDGTTLDKKTGLIWKRCLEGQNWNNGSCQGNAATLTWPKALSTAEAAVFAGNNDWRLPNQKELLSLVERQCFKPAINMKAFPNAASNWIWSSSPDFYNPGYVWVTSFYYGYDFDGYKLNGYQLRLVRDN